MARWYFDEGNADTSCETGGVGSYDLISTDSATDSTVDTDNTQSTGERVIEWCIGDSTPGDGTYSVSVSVNATSNLEFQIGVEIITTSGCTVNDSDLDTTWQTGTGTKTFTTKSMTYGSSDRIRVYLWGRRASGAHGNASATIDTDHASSYVDPPAGATTNTKTTSLDSYLEKQGLTKTTSLDSYLKKEGLTKTTSFDAVLENDSFKAATIISAVKSGTGNDTFTSSGFNREVDAAIIRISYVTSDDTSSDHFSFSHSLYDGTNLVSIGCTAYDNQDFTDTSRHQWNTIRLYDPTSNTTVILEGTVSTTVDGIIINWTTNSRAGAKITIDLFGGLKNAAVGSFLSSGSINGTASETIGFEADVIYGLSMGLNSVSNSQNTHAWHSIGFCLNDLTQYAAGIALGDNQDTSIVHNSTRNDMWLLRMGVGGQSQYEVTTIGATSFTVTTRNSANVTGLYYLAIEFLDGDTADIVSANCPASTGSQTWNVSSALTPSYVCFVQAMPTSANTWVSNIDASLSIGSGVSATSEASHSIWGEYNQSFSDHLGRRSTNLVYGLHDTNVVDADLVSFAAGQVNLTYGVVQSGRIGFLLAMGASTPTVTKTTSLDSLLQKQALLKTASLDALLQNAGLTKTTSLDSFLQKNGLTLNSSVDALIKKQGEIKTAALDGLLQKTGLTKAASLDALIVLSILKNTTLDALLSKTGILKTASLDALLEKQGLTKTTTLDALIVNSILKTTSLDALIQANIVDVVALDAFIQKQGVTTTTTMDAYLVVNVAKTMSLDAFLQKVVGKQTSIDAIIKAVGLTKTASLDAFLRKTGILKTTQLDALVQQTGISLDTSVDALIQQRDLTLTTALDAFISSVGTLSTSVNALLQKTVTKVLSLDAIIGAVVAAATGGRFLTIYRRRRL